MRRTRHQYHYAVRSARKHDTENRKLRLAEARCANNSKDMWGELKRMNPKGKYLSNVVDGINNDADIANMFADKYRSIMRSLYQSVPTSDLEMDLLIGMLNARIIPMHESNNLAYSIGRPLARNGNFFKNAVIQKKIAVTSKTIQLHIFSRSLD